MILVLDAHAVLWWLADDRSLSNEAATAVDDPANQVVVSAATVWEIEAKRQVGRLQAPPDLLAALEQAAILTVPVTAEDAVTAARLPRHHADPFDRMLVAQATRLDAIIVTRDRALSSYGIEILPA